MNNLSKAIIGLGTASFVNLGSVFYFSTQGLPYAVNIYISGMLAAGCSYAILSKPNNGGEG